MINAFAAGQQFFKFDLYRLASKGENGERLVFDGKVLKRSPKLTYPYVVVYRSQRHFTVLVLLARLIGKEIVEFFIAAYCW